MGDMADWQIDNFLMPPDDSPVCPCDVCGCEGNMECGGEPPATSHGCSLNELLVCPCCEGKEE